MKNYTNQQKIISTIFLIVEDKPVNTITPELISQSIKILSGALPEWATDLNETEIITKVMRNFNLVYDPSPAAPVDTTEVKGILEDLDIALSEAADNKNINFETLDAISARIKNALFIK